jgi:hypothetical protein
VTTPVDLDMVEGEIRAIRRARANDAMDRIRAQAKARGLDALTMDEIDRLIAEARRCDKRRSCSIPTSWSQGC